MGTTVRFIGLEDADNNPAIADAADILRAGGLVAFPTETVYGLGADALNADAVAKIFAAKGRPATNPVIVHVSSVDQAKTLVTAWPQEADRLVEKFWPGPLTLILSKSKRVPDIVTAGGPTVALRMPAHPVARELLRQAGVPVAAPSANRSESLSSTTAQHVAKSLHGRVDMILDAGATSGGMESTVVDLTVKPPVIRRYGLLSYETLREFGVSEPTGDEAPGVAVSPGMHRRHYAPSVPLHLISSLQEGLKENFGFLVYGDVDVHAACVERLPSDSEGYMRGLYASLHRLEDSGVDGIYALLPPKTTAWLAVHDRLVRASAR